MGSAARLEGVYGPQGPCGFDAHRLRMIDIKRVAFAAMMALAACGPKASTTPQPLTSATVVIDAITPLPPMNPCAGRPQVAECGVPTTEQK